MPPPSLGWAAFTDRVPDREAAPNRTGEYSHKSRSVMCRTPLFFRAPPSGTV
jgi:hypothetical protein